MSMAALLLKGVLQLFIILYLPYFLSAQFLDYPTAQVSTSWTNNDLSAVNFTFGSSLNYMRVILLKKRPNTVTSGFACGFLSNKAHDLSIFAIVRVYFQERWYIIYDDDVWFANGNKPVRENATIQLLPDGNLVLRDVDGTLVWSTNTSNMSVVGMEIMETGNLVLYNGDNTTVWDSSHHPADYPTAQVSTSWTNIDLSVVNIESTSPPVMRNILLKEIPDTRNAFACGFLSNEAYDSFVFAIGKVQIQEGPSLSKPDVVWYANRNKPVRENATIQLLPDGNLVLRDVDGTLVWSTNTSNMSVVGMKIMETGNLVLYNADNMTVWQSFDHPADTLLPGQKLVEGQKLVASASATNWTEGIFYLSVTSQGLFAFYQSNMPQMYFNLSVRGIGPTYVKYIDGTLALFKLSAEQSEPDAVFSKLPYNSIVQYMRFESNGHFRLFDGQNREDLLPVSECDYPTVCGNYGICLNGSQCTCPRGFAEDNVLHDQSFSGCSEINPTTCQNTQSLSLVELSDVYYFSYLDNNAAVLRGTDVGSCKRACLKNCSCKVALFQYSYDFSHGNCFLPSPVLSLIGDGKERVFYKSSAFIKISNDLENGTRSTSKSAGIVAGSSLGAFFIALLVISIWIVFWRKKKNTEEDEEDYLDQVSGMPMRFSYEELKVATGDFHEKLGQGGFGSVFEGSLGNGVKIAVKRLDGSGQGKKEFLAEVNTIGSIHHVNLARLIGFCVEKSQRLLVYEFMCNGSLDKWIFHTNQVRPTLDWQSMRKIILDIAKGLAYLHEECRQRIIHLDIKPQNILLDANFHAKISDFGLSKLIDREQSHVVTMMRGTPGYMAPEWLSSVITEKVDVYSFGIVVMEMVCGRKNIDRSQPEECMHLLALFMRKAKDDQLIDMVDKYSEDMQLHGTEAVEMMRVAAWCLQSDFNRRPSMSRVVKVLEGTMDIEVDIDYSFSNQTTMAAIKRETELCATATLLPSILSGPR